MESKTNYTIVGALILLFVSGLILTGIWLSVGFDKKVYRTFSVFMNEPVFGLSEQAPVKFNGVDVGYVVNLAINRTNPQQVSVLIEVEQGTPITTSTTAVLQSQGITGIRYIELQAGSQYAEPLIKMAGETYPVIPSRPSLWVQLDAALRDVTENFQKVTDAFSTVLDRENSIAIKNSLRNVEHFIAVMSQHSKQLSTTLESADVIFKNAAQASKELPEAVNQITVSGRAVTKMANDLSVAGRWVSSTMKSSKIVIDDFSSQTIPQTNDLMLQLDNLARDIASLTKSLKKNPSMLIRGRKPRKLGPGEK